jgi:SAM-dependent methyltransferase
LTKNEIRTRCAICNTEGNSDVRIPSNFDEHSFTTQVFSARRMPDRRYFQWVECKECSLWRSDPIIVLSLEQLYKESSFDYGDEVSGLSKTYLNLFARTKPANNPSVLEIGGGNGFFLDALLDKYNAQIAGVEPSIDAVNKASDRVKPHMVTAMMEDGLFSNGKFSQVCIFHVLDHLPNPASTLNQIRDVLADNGSVLIAVHNVDSWSSKLLKSKSPIFDVEHTFLYSKKSLTRLLIKCGYADIQVKGYWNLYSVKYLLQLSPIPLSIKKYLNNNKVASKLTGKILLWVPLGNMTATARKSM